MTVDSGVRRHTLLIDDVPAATVPDPRRAVEAAAALVLSRYGRTGAAAAGSPLSDPDSHPVGQLLAAEPQSAGSITGPVAVPLEDGVVELSAHQRDGGLLLTATVTDGSDRASAAAEALLGHLGVVLRAAAAHPEQPFGTVDILTEAERHRVLVDWNGPEVTYPATTLHRMFSEQAARTPDAVAIIDGGETLTYAQVDRASNRVAHQLRAHVSRPGQVIAVAVGRTAATLTVKIGVMKAGAAFMYLDPATPANRADLLCRIAEPVAAIVSRQADRAPAVPVVLLLEDLLADAAAPDDAPDDIADESTAAYILFTSGSTGEPKGVVRPHRMHTTRVLLEQKLYCLGPGDRHLMKSVPFFREFYWALATGGTLVVARPGGERDDEYLIDLIRSREITVCSFVPSMLRILVANPRFRSSPLPIRHLFVAGEVLEGELEHRLREQGLALHVTYTLAEADYVCHRSGPPATTTGAGSGVAVGRPIDMRIYLCDPQGRLCPPGSVGEFYTGGPGLADGYLNRPELTGERFLPNPFDPDRTPTLFRTGDLGRFRPDGEVEFIGRADGQIKIRGQRVEPTEVERAIRNHHGVADAAVAGMPDPGQGYLLMAYVVAADGPIDLNALRADLAEHLPSYMIPTYLVPVATLPMLGSGKLDRSSLKTVLAARPGGLGPAEPPADELERRIARAWSRVLGVDDIGVDDEFTALGGDSLRMMVLRIALEHELGEPVALATLISAPTIRDFADQLGGGR